MNETNDKIIKIGTRGSKLALIQTEMVTEKLKKAFPDFDFVKVEITTKGDVDKTSPIHEFGGKAVFVEDIEKAIFDGTIDIAVHSAKDMPNPCARGLAIAGVLERANPKDVLIYKKILHVKEDSDFVIGTSSLRRSYQILEKYKNAHCKDLRGNIGTRINKLKNDEYDAIILAKAGISRQGLDKDEDLIYEELSIDELVPAAGQGIIAIESKDKGVAYEMCKTISDKKTEFILETERMVLSKIGASCHEPVGVFASLSGEEMVIEFMKMDSTVIRKSVKGSMSDRDDLVDLLCEE